MQKPTGTLAAVWLCALLTVPAFAAPPAAHPAPGSVPVRPVPAPKSRQSVTSGSVSIGGHSIRYKAIAGIMVVKNAKGKPYTSMSYFAYIKC